MIQWFKKYKAIGLKSLKKYFKTRNERVFLDNGLEGELKNIDSFQAQVVGTEGIEKMAECWKKYGSELEYIREILEYVDVSEGFYTDREQVLIKNAMVKQNKFLEECYRLNQLDIEYGEVVSLEE